jgi:hypothetical protein
MWTELVDELGPIGIEVWDGDDGDFPQFPRIPGMPSRVWPLTRESTSTYVKLNPGQLNTDPYLDGISNLLVRVAPSGVRDMTIGHSRESRRFHLRNQASAYLLIRTTSDATSVRCEVANACGGSPRRFGLESTIVYEEETDPQLRLLHKIEHNRLVLESRYNWSVTVAKSPSTVAMSLSTDATGVLSMLKDRERSGSRRKPLLHWCQEHLRQTRKNDDVVYVKEHLRGARTVMWRGYRVQIRESELEREKFAP